MFVFLTGFFDSNEADSIETVTLFKKSERRLRLNNSLFKHVVTIVCVKE